jgi:ABC-type uncharacterized transport system ATPase subunit
VANASTIDAPLPGKIREGMLRTEGLTIRFGGLTALDGVNLEIARGEVRAIIGPNGAQKAWRSPHLLNVTPVERQGQVGVLASALKKDLRKIADQSCVGRRVKEAPAVKPRKV